MSLARQMFNEATRRVGQTHLAESSDIANASICGRKFLLPRMLGATGRGNEKYIPGTITHNILDSVGDGIRALWSERSSAEQILEAWKKASGSVYEDFARRSQARGYSADKHIQAAQLRLEGIARVLAVHFGEYPPPEKVLTEITIANPGTRHEGRIDAIFEYGDRSETVDWKTNVSGSITQYERIQIVANGMLVNYRYGRDESNFTGNKLTIFTPEGVHHPIATEKALDDVRSARRFILDSLAGLHPHNDLPSLAVCYECSYHDPCRFYMYDRTPEAVKKLLWNRRFRVLKKREKAHLNKFLAVELPAAQLAELGILEQDYKLQSYDQKELALEKAEDTGRLFPGDSVRVFGLERGIPLLACVSCNGSVKEVKGKSVKVQVFRGKTTDLVGLPIAILRADVDLSRRELESIDRVHRRPGPFQDLALALIGEVSR